MAYANNLLVYLQTNQPGAAPYWPPQASKGPAETGQRLSALMAEFGSGHVGAGLLQVNAASGVASQTGQISGGSGAVGATIAGTLVTVTWATNDATTVAALVAAINAQATVSKYVTAVVTTPAGQTTPGTYKLQANLPGELGNLVTDVASGTGSTVGGATLTGGLLGSVNTCLNAA